MPSHLEQFPIDIDEGLQNWEVEHEADYTAAKSSGPARLERCVAEGERAAMESQGANVLKQFPDVRFSWPSLIHTSN